MKTTFKIFFGIWIFGSTALIGNSQIRYLKHDWLIYDNTSKQLYPFVKKNKENLPLHLSLKPYEFKGLFVNIKSSENVSLYVNNQFFDFFEKDKSNFVPFDSLKIQNGNILLSFYGIYNSTLIDSCSISYGQIVNNNASKHIASNSISKNYGKSYFALLLLTSGMIFVFFRNNYTKAFNQYFNLQDLFLNFKVESSQSRSSFEGYYFAFVLIGSTFFGLACLGLQLADIRNSEYNFLNYFINLINIVAIAWFFYFLKFLVVKIVSWLFAVEKFATIHFKVFIKVALMWSVALVLINIAGHSNINNVSTYLFPAFLTVSLFFLTLISIKVSILINQVSRISTLYLISYLCLTEWLPYFVILKLYMVYFYN